MLYRVQDHSGRGPYKPQFSHRWADDAGPIVKPWWTELGISVQDAIAKLAEIPADMHVGCAFRSMDKLREWFTPKELRNLDRFGFYVIQLEPDRIVAETDTQVVFGITKPLHWWPQFDRCAGRKAA